MYKIIIIYRVASVLGHIFLYTFLSHTDGKVKYSVTPWYYLYYAHTQPLHLSVLISHVFCYTWWLCVSTVERKSWCYNSTVYITCWSSLKTFTSNTYFTEFQLITHSQLSSRLSNSTALMQQHIATHISIFTGMCSWDPQQGTISASVAPFLRPAYNHIAQGGKQGTQKALTHSKIWSKFTLVNWSWGLDPGQLSIWFREELLIFTKSWYKKVKKAAQAHINYNYKIHTNVYVHTRTVYLSVYNGHIPYSCTWPWIYLH